MEIVLTGQETAEIDSLVRQVTASHESIESASFHRESRIYAHQLPLRVRQRLNDYRLDEPSGALLIRGLPVREAMLCPTPSSVDERSAAAATLRYDVAFFLLASLLGDPIGWATQQNGRLMHDVFPVRGYESIQIGWGSDETLTWHTEDAFHPFRADYLGLMCLRNPDQVPTTIADMGDIEIPDNMRDILFNASFFILPDDSHQAVSDERNGDDKTARLLRLASERVRLSRSDPEPVAILFGDPDQPYIRFDPDYMRATDDLTQRQAVDTLRSEICARLREVTLQPGDICFIDNFRAVHGRSAFKARFDGTDRWLRRLNIARDLRFSRQVRASSQSRVIY